MSTRVSLRVFRMIPHGLARMSYPAPVPAQNLFATKSHHPPLEDQVRVAAHVHCQGYSESEHPPPPLIQNTSRPPDRWSLSGEFQEMFNKSFKNRVSKAHGNFCALKTPKMFAPNQAFSDENASPSDRPRIVGGGWWF